MDSTGGVRSQIRETEVIGCGGWCCEMLNSGHSGAVLNIILGDD